MKVVFHEDFYQVYTSDPASEPGRIEAIVAEIEKDAEFIAAHEASEAQILTVHAQSHVEHICSSGLYHISALAAGGAIQTATIGLTEPCFGLIRPPGHHASADSAWGFCFFNNMAIALEALKNQNKIQTAHVLDFDLHYGDGNVNILGTKNYITIHNPQAHQRESYIQEVKSVLEQCQADIIGISAGFDNHQEDWGGLLRTDDYRDMGHMVRKAARRNNGGFFAILEGGYNHQVLGKNAKALILGMAGI
ncbi:MAG: histone deacetylase family protein [Desulfobacterales bacterium]|nr:histone deacetylase family protein [Desulfobacterales bacterium]